MSVLLKEISEFMEEIAPKKSAESWDNIGIMYGGLNKKINKVLVCLDVTMKVVDEAVKEKADLIFSHHPLIFKALKSISEDDIKGRMINKLIKNDIAVYSAHTNLDVAENGVNQALAELLGINVLNVLKEPFLNLTGKRWGLGRVGFLEKPVEINEFIDMLKNTLKTEKIRMIGNTAKKIEKVAVFCGSFDEDLEAVKRQNVDVLVTGDVKYHTALDAVEDGMCIIDAGHHNTEKIIVPVIVKALTERFPGLQVIGSTVEQDPFVVC